MRKISILVHPFYLDERTKRKGGLNETTKERLAIYKSRISAISKNSGHHVLFEPAPDVSGDSWDAFDALVTYARNKLGKGRVIVEEEIHEHTPQSAGGVLESLRRAGLKPSKVVVHIYGEYADQCVSQRIRNLAPLLVSKSRRRVAVRPLLEFSASPTLPGYAFSHESFKEGEERHVQLHRWVQEDLSYVRRLRK